MIGELLGIPPADRRPLHAWFQVLLTGMGRRAGRGGRGIRPNRGLPARPGRHQAAESGRRPCQRPVAAGDDALTTQELLSSLFQLVVAGHDTTASLIGNGVVALLDHPGQLAALLADPGRLPAAIDELSGSPPRCPMPRSG